jgi:secondary thiamine-phosphate synthase enzyme
MKHYLLNIETAGEGDIIDITPGVRKFLSESGLSDGIADIFCEGSTAAITTIEYESGVLEDLKRALNVIAPADAEYKHDLAWGDGNGRSHVRAAIIGPSLTVPFRDNSLLLGTWQQIVLLELDVRNKRSRRVHCTFSGY